MAALQFFPDFYAPTEVTDEATAEVRLVKPWRVVRPTSAAIYAIMRDGGALAESRALVLCAVAALRNSRGYWPTACEVQAWMKKRKQIKDDNPNRVRPRLSELADGWNVIHVLEVDGTPVRTRVRVECDVLVRGPKRKSRITGILCITWRVRERS